MKPAEEYFLNQIEPYQSILLNLKAIIEAVVPEITLEYKWKLPFYYLHGRPLFYLNQTKNYVDLGFWHAHLLEHYQHYFISENRKAVKSLRYFKETDIDEEILKDVIETIANSDFHPFKR